MTQPMSPFKTESNEPSEIPLREDREQSTSTFASSAAADTLLESRNHSIATNAGVKEKQYTSTPPPSSENIETPQDVGGLVGAATGRSTGLYKPDNGRDPFAGGLDGGVNYCSMAWWQAGMVMVAEIISLGILALPKTMATLGLVPGLIILVFLGIMSTSSGYVIGQLKLTYPHIHSMAEAGEILMGGFGRELLGFAQSLFYIFVMGSHLLTFSIAMNAITDHGACTIIFMVAGFALSLLCTLPRTMKHLSYYSVVSFMSIIGAVMVTMVGVSISKPGFSADTVTGERSHEVRLWPEPGLEFHNAFLAVCNMVFAYAGNVAFFSFISELKQPQDFPKALAFLQTSDILMYIITSVVIYYYAGNEVKSPALDSATNMVRKVAYGVALPTIIIAGVVNGHVGVKYVYVRLFRDSPDDVLHQRSFKAVGSWIAICTLLWFVAWLIAEVVPVFSDLLGVTSALFASWFTYGLSGFFWIHMNFIVVPAPMDDNGRRQQRWWRRRLQAKKPTWSWRMYGLFVLSLINIMIGAVVCVLGLYSVSKSIRNNSVTKKPFSCADNSG